MTPAATDVYDQLQGFKLSQKVAVLSPIAIASITNPNAGLFQINFGSSLPAGISAGMLGFIDLGANEGHKYITATGSNYVQFQSTTAIAQGAIGSVQFYKAPIKNVNDIMFGRIKPYMEKTVRTTLDSVSTYTDVVDGTGKVDLFMPRRHIQSVVAIQLLNIPNSILTIPTVAIEVLGEKGILRIRNFRVENYQQMAALWPQGESNVKVTYTAGFTDWPVDLFQACILFTSADVLGREASFTGGGTSLSVEGWSKSFGPRGPYGEARDDMVLRARTLLRRYMTGITN
jgi:hypothetical protein